MQDSIHTSSSSSLSSSSSFSSSSSSYEGVLRSFFDFVGDVVDGPPFLGFGRSRTKGLAPGLVFFLGFLLMI